MNFLGVGEHALLGFETLVFSWMNSRVVDFALLECPEVNQAQALLLSVFELLYARVNLFPFCERLANGIELYSGKCVQEFQPDRAVERN